MDSGNAKNSVYQAVFYNSSLPQPTLSNTGLPSAISSPAGVKGGKRDEWVGRRPVPWDFYMLTEDSRAVASPRKTEGKKISGNNL